MDGRTAQPETDANDPRTDLSTSILPQCTGSPSFDDVLDCGPRPRPPHETARVHQINRWRGYRVAARGARAEGRSHAADRCAHAFPGGPSRRQGATRGV